jgi:diguanylate cyclase (GGDEF)-like protein
MAQPSSRFSLTDAQKRQLSLPGIFIGIVVCVGMILYGWLIASNQSIRLLNIFTGFFGVIYTIAFFYFILPGSQPGRIEEWLFPLANGILIGWVFYIEPYSLPNATALLLVVLILLMSVVTSRIATYAFVLVALISTKIWPYAMGVVPRNNPWSNPVIVLLVAFTTIEVIEILKKEVLRQIRRLETVNQMTRSLASSIETRPLIEIMSQAIQASFQADTYYIGFVDQQTIRLDLFYDHGQFYEGISVNLDGSLSGWVTRNQQSLLLRNTTRQLPLLGIEPLIIGDQKPSLSWMGAPVQKDDTFFGIVAVASYKRNAFSKGDLELLENFASQSATALDNAKHHNEVEERSRMDSLTFTLNHGTFLLLLGNEMERAKAENWPISLIMLDVDFFKQYNDTYGHLIGDQVLIGLTDTIRGHIKSTDLVGRWGGEEFVIALPHSSGSQAIQVAQRVRETLQNMRLTDRNNQVIPPPTISQGIAVFAQEADQAYTLIDLADERLFIAKNRGRDQVEPTVDIWNK